MIWLLFAFMTAAVVAALAWPLLRTPARDQAPDARADYAAELAGFERDAARGLMSLGEAEAARTEAARRFLAAARDAPAQRPSKRRRLSVALALAVLAPTATLALYAGLGSPAYPDAPLEARLAAQPGQMDVMAALAKIEQHLARDPDDARGWAIVAPVFLRLGRYDEAVAARRALRRIEGPSSERDAALGEALVAQAGGEVTPQARAAFEAAQSEDATNAQARFYLALAAEQAGDAGKARGLYTALLAQAPDAPWAPVVRERIAGLGGEAAPPAGPAASLAALPAVEQQQAIRGMVEGLAARLASQGGGVDEWLRLVRAYVVLKEPDKARSALADARRAMTAEGDAREKLDALARDLGLEG